MKTSLIAIGALVAGCGDDSGNNNGVDAMIDGQSQPVGAALPLKTPDGSFYTADLMINGVGYALDLDTGSSSTGIAATACTGCPVTPKYTPGTGAMDVGKKVTTQYGDGSGWSGEVYSDTVTLGGSTPSISLAFVAISAQQHGFFSDNSYQGIFGLGPKENLEPGTTDYLDVAGAAGLAQIMGFEFCDGGGTMWLGGVDESHGEGALKYAQLIPVNTNNPFYAIDVTDMGMAGTSLGFGASSFQKPILDTGTSLFYMPTEVETAMLANINASAGFKALFPSQTLSENNCAQGATTVTAEMVDAMLPKMSMTVTGVDGSPITIEVAPMASYLYGGDPGQVCFAFSDGGTGQNYFGVMGDTLMRAFLTEIDLVNQRVGLAPDKGCNGHKSLVAHQPVHGPGRPTEHGHGPARRK